MNVNLLSYNKRESFLCAYLLVKVHRLQVVDVSTLDSLGCLQHRALLQSEATGLDALLHAVNLVKKCVCVSLCVYYLLCGLHRLDHLSRNTGSRRAGV